MKLLIIKTGSTIDIVRRRRGDFEDWFRASLAMSEREAVVVAPFAGEPLPRPSDVPAVVITGSPAMVTDELDWSVALEAWVREFVESGRPLLGVCYGHQLLAKALGGVVSDHPKGSEVGTIRVRLSDAGKSHALLAGIPNEFAAQATHRQSVIRLPQSARLLAGGTHDPHQAFAIGDEAIGVQFHPEFDADIMRGYLRARTDPLAGEGIDVEAVLAGVGDTPFAAQILENFRDRIDFERETSTRPAI
ncbi:MAG: glutamine amidotransferase [Planctomycetota bacterium]